ncbi:MAG: type VI secretion system protein TssA [Planctomycetota bacterium]
MASPPAFEIDPLLAPIGGDSPGGSDLTADGSPSSVFYEIKGMRDEARAAERGDDLGAHVTVDEVARWRPVAELAPKILASETKDLRVVAMWIEALARTDGFAGLRDGFRLTRELVESYWDQLHPMPDEDGIETRVAPLSGLNGMGGPGVLASVIQRIPLTQEGESGPVPKWIADQAAELDRLEPDVRASRIADGSTSMDQVHAAVAQTDPAFFADLLEDVLAALEEWRALTAVLDERAGADAPPSSQLVELFEDVASCIRHIAKDRLPIEVAPADEDGEAQDSEAPTGSGSPAPAAGAIAGREQALRNLAEIADFFRRTEPHSPLAYLLERAVRWGRTPLPQLLAELIPDQGARSTFNALTGVEPSESPTPE